MSGSHRGHAQPQAGARRVAPHEADQPYEQSFDQAYGQAYDRPFEAVYEPRETRGQRGPDGTHEAHEAHGAHETYDTYGGVYEQPRQPYRPYPQELHRQPAEGYGQRFEQAPYEPQPSEPSYRPSYEQPSEPPYEDAHGLYEQPAPVHTAPPPAAAPGPSAATTAPPARGRRRKAKEKKSHGRALTAGTALLLAVSAGWYTVGPGRTDASATRADAGGTPEPHSTPDQALGAPPAAEAAGGAAAGGAAADPQRTDPAAASRSESRTDASVDAIPGIGAAFAARIPAETNQVVLASGKGKDSNETTVTVWTRTAEGRWQAGESWAGHNAYRGWTTDHHDSDLRSPIGVFALTDAGGRKADPGSKLPYDKDPSFVVGGTGFAGEPLAGSFDYVVAINYNRVSGNSPLDTRRPDGNSKGGGIWIHVDHGGPTHGCISVPEDKMAQLIRTLDPAAHPMIVMGDADSLAA
ncbi:L,D-transpeptidase family protein [Kitasatospora sp. NPDC050543]|uniref:L,D-transpeptidase family protein n=1 Tax=Kitasatospora sp. NPDC050543 TaxID=3364054 RepID=UPI00378F9036